MLIRDIDGADLEAVCDLVDADRLSGQPPCRVDKVQNALAGRAEIDVLYWQKLRELRSLVATSGTGGLHGAGSLGIDHDGVRYLLWLLFVDHGYDQRDPRSPSIAPRDSLWSTIYGRIGEGRSHPIRDPAAAGVE